ncbi:DUF4255 domain-containing protein [Rhizobium sp. WYCCWR 11128]|uniref:DUF4255 domain-containing protein n=1 Tax=Rhizobium sp. WYCCWR 11128 TaxID=2749832 RepID=UPI0015D243BD|nr:DUF4255 domain-containing protein [Rhizobium sp. WYCCWR 11128]NYT32041.1 DUF4255 domain-containing protein [Rhizobium sp. WYCCWR 11128]
MTAHFAVPATTFVLKALCEARLKAAYGNFPAPSVKLEPPPRPAPTSGAGGQPEAAALYLFLHHAAQNPAWRNMHEPTVNSLGQRTDAPPLVLDLYYLLFATGADLEREVLFSLGLTAFRRNGIIPRPMIQAILGAIAVPANPTKLLETLTAEPLHDPASQPEQITISQEPYDLDRSTKLWSALQAPLRPTALFQVTSLFLDIPQQFQLMPDVEAVGLRLRPNANPASPPVDDDLLEVTS